MFNKSGVLGALMLGALAVWTQGCDEPARVVPIEDADVELARGYCAPMFDCECSSGRNFGEEQQCTEQMSQQIEQLRTAGEMAGLTYDPTCLGSFLEQIDSQGCGAYVPSSQCQVPCRLYFGAAQEGEPCEYLSSGLSSCDQGLSCDGQVCRNPCQRASRGESCTDTACGEGLYCGFAQTTIPSDPTCLALPERGQECPMGECAAGSFCDQPDPMDPSITQCVALAAEGEACSGHSQCTTGHCPRGACEPMPLRGQPCPAGACDLGLQCVEGVCEQADPMVCFAYPPV